MLKLFCAIVGGTGSAFEVELDDSASVSAWRDEIKRKNSRSITCDAKALQLFLAKKTVDGAWLGLDEEGAASVVLIHGHAQHSDTKLVEIESLQPLKTFVGELGEQDQTQVHVLVVVPKYLAVDPQLLQLQELLLRHTLMDAPASSSAQSIDFKASLIRTYQCDMGTYPDDINKRMLRCMLLDMALPSELVIASHLFRQKNDFLCRDLMGSPTLTV